MRKKIWLLAVVLGACSHTHGPQDSTQTGNPPALDEGRLMLVVSAGEVHITGAPGAASPGGTKIEITNLTSGEKIEGTANADGSFDLRVDGSLDDAFAVRAVTEDESSSPVYVVRGGAAIAGEDDGSLSCEQYSELAGSVLEASAAAADRSCQSDRDCGPVLKIASCFNACEYAYVTNAGANQIQTTGESLDEGLCAAYAENGCASAQADCATPKDAACVDGTCSESAGALSCQERAAQAMSVVSKAITAADQSCERDSDCVTQYAGGNCYDSCPGPHPAVSSTGKSQIDAAAAEVNGGLCASFLADGCVVIPSTACPVSLPTEPRCNMGQCWLVPVTDSGMPDCVTCFTETLRWGPNGGLVGYLDLSEIAPCALYKHRRVTSDDPSGDTFACERELVACNASASTGAVMSALSNAEVQQAFSDSPIVYGSDPRGVDGQVLEITLGSQTFYVGRPCESSEPGCTAAIPPGVQALADLLQSIDQEMLMTTECAAFKP